MSALTIMESRLAELTTRGEAVVEEIDELATRDELTEEDETRFTELETEGVEIAEERATLETSINAEVDKQEKLRQLKEKPNVRTLPGSDVRKTRDNGDPYELGEIRAFGNVAGELRGRALKAVEDESRYSLTDSEKEQVTFLLERKDDKQGTIAKLVLATGSDDYRKAWAKAVTGRSHQLTGSESDALARAASLTDAAGGFAVPFPIDPTLILTNEGSANPYRRISRVETITTDSWQGISAGAVTSSWDAEAAEVSDDTPTWAQPAVPAHMARAFVPASIQIAQDYPGLAEDLRMAIAEGKDELEGAAFAVGTGSGQPTGIVTALVAGADNVPTSATADTYAKADVYATLEALPPKYRKSGSTWTMALEIINLTRQFGTTDDAFMADLTAGQPPQLLGLPLEEASGMDSSVTAAADNYIAAVGDFSNYLIADRVGLSIEYIPHLFATANNLPSGQRGWFAYWRVGADSINDAAFALLNVT